MATSAGTGIWRSLRYRNFQLFFTGQLISLIGSWMQTVAVSWLVYRLTGSSAQLGLINFAGQIPIFLLSPIAGYAADRFQRLRVVMITQTTAMILSAVLATLTLSGWIRLWELYLLATMMGITSAFDVPARQSLFVDMVGREDLMNAIALNASIYNSARMVGPAIAGILVARIGEGWCFALNAASFVAVLIALRLMNVPPAGYHRPVGSPWQTIREGVLYSARTTPFRELLSLLAVVSFFGTPYLVLMPIFADRSLHSGAEGFGVLMASCGGGALGGALLMASRTQLRQFPGWTFFATMSFPLALAVFTWSSGFRLSCWMAGACSCAIMIQLNSTNTLMQSIVPDRLRGRIVSLYSMMYLGVAPLGAAAAGFVAESLGPRRTLAVGAVVCILAGLLFLTRIAAVRASVGKMIQERDRAFAEA